MVLIIYRSGSGSEGKRIFSFLFSDFGAPLPGGRPRRGPPPPPLRVPDRQSHARLVLPPPGVRLGLAGALPRPGEAVAALARLERRLEVRRGADGVWRGGRSGGSQIGEERRRVAAEPAPAAPSSASSSGSSRIERA